MRNQIFKNKMHAFVLYATALAILFSVDHVIAGESGQSFSCYDLPPKWKACDPDKKEDQSQDANCIAPALLPEEGPIETGLWKVIIPKDENPTPYDREYYVYIPTDHKDQKTMPLLVHIHGLDDTAIKQYNKSKLKFEADRGNFIVVFPQGKKNSFNAIECCGYAWDNNIDDIGLMLTIIDKVSKRVHKIDKKRIYVSGHSNGAKIAHLLACQHSNIVAAIAPISGNNPIANPDYHEKSECSPLRKVPVISFMGIGYQDWLGVWYGDFYNYFKGIDRDPYGCGILRAVLPIKYGALCDNSYDLGFKKDFEFWGNVNECNKNYETNKTDGKYDGKHAAYSTTYNQCSEGVKVSYHHLHAGHIPVFADAEEDHVCIGEKAWQFLKNYRLNSRNQPPSGTVSNVRASGKTVLLEGTCIDDSGTCQVKIRLGNSPWFDAEIDKGSSLWSFQKNFNLNIGTYEIKVKFADNKGQEKTISGGNVVLTPSCVTATNKEHKDAGRAYYALLRYYAKGSDDYLGTSSSVKTLKITAVGHWEKVDRCE